MTKKQVYIFKQTLKENNLINYDRVNDNRKRKIILNNKLRHDICPIHLRTENLDKWFNTRFLNLTNMFLE